jgi:uncharacterized protein
MTKEKKNKSSVNNNRTLQLIAGFVIITFIVFLFADLLIPKKKVVVKHEISNSEIYKFTKEGELTFQTEDGNFISSIDAEFADNEQEREQGLMYRTEMEENQGMLFIFPNQNKQSFWMKNTVLPLDIIFVNSNLEIVTIQKNAVPYSEQSLPSTAPAQYVVEVNAGYTEKYNVKVGDKVVFRKTN